MTIEAKTNLDKMTLEELSTYREELLAYIQRFPNSSTLQTSMLSDVNRLIKEKIDRP
jgi:hypothetical protein